LVVFDDVELPLGRLRLRRGGSPGGHRGMESVMRNLRTELVPRLRLGIRPETDTAPADLVEFVLEPFRADERPAVEELIERAADACQAWLELDIETAMNRFNG
jgi:PTH1 family peptidyl-tRNA hydrolase